MTSCAADVSLVLPPVCTCTRARTIDTVEATAVVAAVAVIAVIAVIAVVVVTVVATCPRARGVLPMNRLQVVDIVGGNNRKTVLCLKHWISKVN